MNETEVKICDIASAIHYMCPILIRINDDVVWSDDVDLTDVSDEEADILMQENSRQYASVLGRTDLIVSISFKVVQHHHTEVDIKTK